MQEIHLERTALEAVAALEIPQHAMKQREYVHMDVQVLIYRKHAAFMLVRVLLYSMVIMTCLLHV